MIVVPTLNWFWPGLPSTKPKDDMHLTIRKKEMGKRRAALIESQQTNKSFREGVKE